MVVLHRQVVLITSAISNVGSSVPMEQHQWLFAFIPGRLKSTCAKQNVGLKLFVVAFINDSIICLYFSRKNPTEFQELEIGNVESLLLSNFNASLSTKIYAPGWNNDGQIAFPTRDGIFTEQITMQKYILTYCYINRVSTPLWFEFLYRLLGRLSQQFSYCWKHEDCWRIHWVSTQLFN